MLLIHKIMKRNIPFQFRLCPNETKIDRVLRYITVGSRKHF